MDMSERAKIRLSDRILSALELALEQDDVKIAELLTSAMELSMTRNTGGGEFIERRDYPPEIEKAMDKLKELKKSEKVA
ncbi:MAG: hypothetical protein CMH27_11685 [Micavibrio sp.]|nr:hypothetical protein [Micavibrio sp.]|tara:strand:- start:363 stop:599 length:237 start_codon:yes stop_codon:yes gene_type:complete